MVNFFGRAARQQSMLLQREVIRIVIIHILRHPQHNRASSTLAHTAPISSSKSPNSPQHDQPISDRVRDPKPKRRPRPPRHHILEHHDRLPKPQPSAKRTSPRPPETKPSLPLTSRKDIRQERQGKERTHHAASKATGHERKPEEQDEPRLPRDAVAGVAEAVGAEARLVDAVDDEHAERGAHARHPVHERHVHVARVDGRVRVRRRVHEEVEAEGELCARARRRGGALVCGYGLGVGLRGGGVGGFGAGEVERVPTRAPARYTPAVRALVLLSHCGFEKRKSRLPSMVA